MSEATKKLFKWEGKKEIGWILAFLLLFLVAWAYFEETKTCRNITKTDCYRDCEFWEIVKLYQQEHPGVMMQCNVTTKSCEMYGVGLNELGNEIKYNITLYDSNNSFPDT